MKSKHYKYWKSVFDLRRCIGCKKMHGQIFLAHSVNIEPPLHNRCRCKIEWLEAKKAGTASKFGLRGADWWLKTFSHLPNHYISEKEARLRGWSPILANLDIVAPGKMIKKGVFKNRNKHLPDAVGRVWFEADINYEGGFRGSDRILYSNDGLIFVTYDHYMTYVEIV